MGVNEEKVNIISQMAQSILKDNAMIMTEELEVLRERAKTDEEDGIYVALYNYLLGQKQQEVIKNEKY